MGGKYKGKHAAGNVKRDAMDSAEEMTEEERLEREAKGRRTASDVKEAGERLKDMDQR